MQDVDSYLFRDAKRRRRRRRIFFPLAALGVIFFSFVIGGSWVLIASPVFQLTEIYVTGNNLVPREDVINLLQSRILSAARWKRFLGLGNILVWPEKLRAEEMAFYPTIQNISIEKEYMRRRITATIEERVAIGVWCYQKTQINADVYADERGFTVGIKADTISENPRINPHESASSCWRFDDQGVIFRRSPATEGGLITTVRDFSQTAGGMNSKILPERFLENFLSIMIVIRRAGINERGIMIKDLVREEVEVATSVGPTLYFSLRFPADGALSAISRLERAPGLKKLQYVDFRVEDKVYYR